MNQYEINTAQNVTLKLTIANMGDRILAALFDLGIMIGYFFLFYVIYQRFVVDAYSTSAMWYLRAIIALPLCFYSLGFEYFMNGQTPGKRILKIKVVRMDGESLTFGNCLIRWLFRLIDIWFDSGSVAIVVATFSKLNQRLGDLLAGTIVISIPKQINRGVDQYVDANVMDEVVFPQVERLRFQDAEIINQALNLYYDLDKFDFVNEVAQKLKILLDVIPDMDDLTFVKRVITDYNILHRVL